MDGGKVSWLGACAIFDEDFSIDEVDFRITFQATLFEPFVGRLLRVPQSLEVSQSDLAEWDVRRNRAGRHREKAGLYGEPVSVWVVG